MSDTVGMTWEQRPITVYRVVRTERVQCDLDEWHERGVVARKFLGPVVDRVSHNNGYGTQSERVRLDAQGRRWESRSPIDFSGSTHWVAPSNVFGSLWDSRPPSTPYRFLRPADVALVTRVVA